MDDFGRWCPYPKWTEAAFIFDDDSVVNADGFQLAGSTISHTIAIEDMPVFGIKPT